MSELAAAQPTGATPPASRWWRTPAAVAGALGLAALAVLGALSFGEPGQAFPWVQPGTESICLVAELAVAYLCLERHRTRAAPLAWWTGLVFIAAFVVNLFYVLTFPGLMGPYGVIGTNPSTSAYCFDLQYAVLGAGTALAAAQAGRHAAPRTAASRVATLCAAVAASLAVSLATIALAEANALPALVGPGGFTAAQTWLNRGVAVLLVAAGAVLTPHTQRYRPWLSRPLLWSVALSAAAVLASEFPLQRYDAGWYAVRVVRLSTFGVVFFSLLREYAGLYRDERRRADVQADLAAAAGELAALQAPADIMRALGRRLRSLAGSDRSVAVFVLQPQSGGRGDGPLAVPAFAEGTVAPYILAAGSQPSGRGFIGQVLRTGRPYAASGPDDPIAVPVPGAPDRPGAVLAVPLLGGTRPLGAAILTRNGLTPYDEVEIEAANLFAQLASAALERAYQTEQIDRMKSEFVSLVSHELRTPLTSIKGYVDLLLEPDGDPLTAEQRDFLDVVRKNAARLSGLIEDLLDLSRIESGKVHLRLDAVDARQEVAMAAASLRRQFDQKQQKLTIRLPDTLPCVMADQARLQQVLVNLLSNANKYTPAGGAVSISGQVGEDGAGRPPAVRIAVRDTGIGMSADDLAHVFEPFYRAPNDATQRERGTGLGLSISKSLVELMGGQMAVTSVAGQGSTFSFSLPVDPDARLDGTDGPARPGAGRRVLLSSPSVAR